jgi:hypothetical protein
MSRQDGQNWPPWLFYLGNPLRDLDREAVSGVREFAARKLEKLFTLIALNCGPSQWRCAPEEFKRHARL